MVLAFMYGVVIGKREEREEKYMNELIKVNYDNDKLRNRNDRQRG